ncbi:hypothetical protein CC78DRAFT_453269, partial [Lojkania enalia]
VFNYKTKVKARYIYRLLILDSYNSYISIDFINYYNKNKILLTIYTPYLTYIL